MHKTTDLKLNLLGIVPGYEDETGRFDPQSIAALSALMTFKGKSIQKLKEEALQKDKSFAEQIQKILQNSSLKGHASVATTPVLSFNYEASKFIDSALTGLPFASALMHSGRRTGVTLEDIVIPTEIAKKPQAKKLYLEESEQTINLFNELLAKGLPKDYVSKILQYGHYGTGIFSLSIESILAIKREYELEKEWMPEEVGLLLQTIESELKKLGADLLYFTRFVSPSSIYPYPNIFKNPQNTNLARIMRENTNANQLTKIVDYSVDDHPDLKKSLQDLDQKLRNLVQNKTRFKKEWFGLLLERQRLVRDFGLAAFVRVLSNVSWRVWGDKKRHRTVPMTVDSIYYAIERAQKIFFQNARSIENGNITSELITKFDQVFSVPDLVRTQKDILFRWIQQAFSTLKAYEKLRRMDIKPRDAIFLIPRGIRVDVLQEYNLYNLISGYYPTRACTTAEEQLHKLTLWEIQELKKELQKQGLGYLADMIKPKCQTLGFCPERKPCAVVNKLVPDYDEKWHAELQQDLQEKFRQEWQKLA
ncbi:hypothetical protein COS81_00470 [candidate division WWE3 bacterium CG06_land_8_20_14_3_00_42_16]|uniref:Uncharacterized protein n=4 Tax=Katanobacteria TaxID=422282 RepID=A0A2M7APJ1_UNCKA|nr:MAG: hypothetical protein COS81_00470 [candidate division WWE3 bacterium CG06_land_8_20_14_3_00_42_16]PIZ42259.1 MAG: hypothetical protein COY34_03155 [candidate division WWE3 bacterium CG_4_10_14_0_2_um_filter_42_8]PJA37891.1 MAG: hypothetical protein CO181_01725 [candidate division WWE3 bacterium CG_4_9_14_3_um_filter_43_9]PJC69275.1 MAG: hypothetical protein CO015_00935 [candidate division WWE3 bacterium CG_4_8_14_3_um_filter_42_11]